MKFSRPVDVEFTPHSHAISKKIMDKVGSSLSKDEQSRLRTNLRSSQCSNIDYDLGNLDSKKYQDEPRYQNWDDHNDFSYYNKRDKSHYDNGYNNEKYNKNLHKENSFGPSYTESPVIERDNYHQFSTPNIYKSINSSPTIDDFTDNLDHLGFKPSIEPSNIVISPKNKTIEYVELPDNYLEDFSKPTDESYVKSREEIDYDVLVTLSDVNALHSYEAKSLFSQTNNN